MSHVWHGFGGRGTAGMSKWSGTFPPRAPWVRLKVLISGDDAANPAASRKSSWNGHPVWRVGRRVTERAAEPSSP